MTRQDYLTRLHSHENNMGVVRYYLSMAVIVAHTGYLAGVDLWFPMSSASAVGGFFALSGFLMFHSYGRNSSLPRYVQRRARRILPPYVFIVLLAALGLAAASSLSAAHYFGSRGFWAYLGANLSFLNFLHPDLPGVFQGAEFRNAAVNGSLWTMKCEWACYLSVPLIFWVLRRVKAPAWAVVVAIIALSMAYRAAMLWLYQRTGGEIYSVMARQFGWLMSFFCVGGLIRLQFARFMRLRWPIFALCVPALCLSDFIPGYHLVLLPPVVGTLVLWFSLVGTWGVGLSRHDNVSYDMYLFHYPLIQLAVMLGLNRCLSPLALLGVVTAATVALACASWNLVGKRLATPRPAPS